MDTETWFHKVEYGNTTKYLNELRTLEEFISLGDTGGSWREQYIQRITRTGARTPKSRCILENLAKKLGCGIITCGELSYLDNETQGQIETPCSEGDNDMAKTRKERVKVGTDANGKPLYAFLTGNSPQEIHEKIAKLYVEHGLISIGEHTAPPSVTAPMFKAYAKKWYTTFKVGTFAPSTEAARNSAMKKHIYPAFAGKRIDEITTADLQAFYNDRAGNGHLKKKSIRLLQIAMNGIFGAAYEDGLIARDPTRSKRLCNPSHEETKRTALTLEQEQSIIADLDKLDGTERLYLSLLIYCGMRKGEALGLKWEDIDLKSGYINICRSATYPSNVPIIKPPKTKAGNRRIPIVPALATLLRANQGIGWLFGNRWDEPIHDEVFRDMWKSIKSKVELFGATSHTFRHTFITLAALEGIAPATVQAVVGHANIATTLAVYTHVQENHLKKAGEQMEQMYKYGM